MEKFNRPVQRALFQTMVFSETSIPQYWNAIDMALKPNRRQNIVWLTLQDYSINFHPSCLP